MAREMGRPVPIPPPDPVDQWCPHSPYPRQQIFLDLNSDLEVFYGGAAGGGKSDALLMAASQYFSWPGYSALILRRTITEGSQASSIMDRAVEWWADRFHYNDSKKIFTFPSGATLRFGYLKAERDKVRYQGAEYQYIGLDELTHFTETQYLYLFSRIRATIDNPVPVRVRSASNPGGLGHFWVKDRFISSTAEQDILRGDYGRVYEKATGIGSTTKFVPARRQDNPAITEDYERSLDLLPKVEREQLKRGNWTIAAEGIFDQRWLRYYRIDEEGGQNEVYVALDDRGVPTARVFPQECIRFTKIDPAGTVQERGREEKGKPSSYSVIGTFDLHVGKRLLFVRDMVRLRCEAPELIANVRRVLNEYRPGSIGCENAGLGLPIYQLLNNEIPGIIEPLETGGKDKYTRSVPLQKWMEQGQVLFPSASDCPRKWLNPLLGEILAWRATPDETADQIDVLSYGAIEAQNHSSNVIGEFVMASSVTRSLGRMSR